MHINSFLFFLFEDQKQKSYIPKWFQTLNHNYDWKTQNHFTYDYLRFPFWRGWECHCFFWTLSLNLIIFNNYWNFQKFQVLSAADSKIVWVCNVGQSESLLPFVGLHPRGLHEATCLLPWSYFWYLAKVDWIKFKFTH